MEVIIDGVRFVPMPDVPAGFDLMTALDIRFDSDAGDNITIRDYLFKLLEALWEEGEGFSGKRPFGNSGWEFDLYQPLIANGFISGKIDEDGCVNSYNRSEAEQYVTDLIKAAFYGVK